MYNKDPGEKRKSRIKNKLIQNVQFMKKLLLLFSFVMVIGFTHAQEYIPIPKDSVVWSELYQHPIDDSIPFQITAHYFGFLGEDTVINDTVYQKLFQFSDTIFDRAHATYMGGMRQENQKVYYRGDYHWESIYYSSPDYLGNERLLYDFSLEEGDTIFFPPPWNSVILYSTVSYVDSMLISGQYRKVIHFGSVFWIEGIGSSLGLLVFEPLPTDGTNLSLICNFHKGELLFHNNEVADSCFPFYTPPEGINDYLIESLTVSPMPVTGTSFIQTDAIQGISKRLYIYNTTGQLVETRNIASNAPIALYSTDFKAGMYSFLLITQNQKYYNGKFIVH